MHKRGIIRYANYTVCASVFIHFCMQRKNNENIPIVKQLGKVFVYMQANPFDLEIFVSIQTQSTHILHDVKICVTV